jgi:hypothetical protein
MTWPWPGAWLARDDHAALDQAWDVFLSYTDIDLAAAAGPLVAGSGAVPRPLSRPGAGLAVAGSLEGRASRRLRLDNLD